MTCTISFSYRSVTQCLTYFNATVFLVASNFSESQKAYSDLTIQRGKDKNGRTRIGWERETQNEIACMGVCVFVCVCVFWTHAYAVVVCVREREKERERERERERGVTIEVVKKKSRPVELRGRTFSYKTKRHHWHFRPMPMDFERKAAGVLLQAMITSVKSGRCFAAGYDNQCQERQVFCCRRWQPVSSPQQGLMHDFWCKPLKSCAHSGPETRNDPNRSFLCTQL